MGGFGSGRYPWSSRDTVEDLQHRSFGIKDWVERGLVEPDNDFTQIWLDKEGRPEASVGIRVEKVSPVHPSLAGLLPDGDLVDDRVQAVLHYRAGPALDDTRPITDIIVLVQSPRGFAGQSWWFCCPGCGRRVADLYPHEAYFHCRKCCGVSYQSQRETRRAHGQAKVARFKQQLGATGGYGEPVPERPKGMQWRTYERLLEEMAEAGWRGWKG
jgi:hypothetical protein